MKISALPAATTLTGAEDLPLQLGADNMRATVALLLGALTVLQPLTVGQQDYDVNISSLGLTAAPRAASCDLVGVANTDPHLDGHMITTGTTQTVMKLHLAQAPTLAGQQMLIRLHL